MFKADEPNKTDPDVHAALVGSTDEEAEQAAKFRRHEKTILFAHRYGQSAETIRTILHIDTEPLEKTGRLREAFENIEKMISAGPQSIADNDGQSVHQEPAVKEHPNRDLLWLYTHCRAIGMTCKSDSGRPEEDIALFTHNLVKELKELRSIKSAMVHPEPGLVHTLQTLQADDSPGSEEHKLTPEQRMPLLEEVYEWVRTSLLDKKTDPTDDLEKGLQLIADIFTGASRCETMEEREAVGNEVKEFFRKHLQ